MTTSATSVPEMDGAGFGLPAAMEEDEDEEGEEADKKDRVSFMVACM